MITRVAPGSGHPEHEPFPGPEGVDGEVGGAVGVGGGGGVRAGGRCAGHGRGGRGRVRSAGGSGRCGSGGVPDHPRQLRQCRPRALRRLPARPRDLRAVGPVEHRPAAQALGELTQDRGDRIRPGGGGRQALLGLGDPAQFGQPGLCHQLPDRAGHPGERGLRRDLQQRQPVPVAGGDQGARDRVVHRGHPEAEGRAARRHDPGDVVVEVGARSGRLGDVHPGREQQLAAQQIGVRVGHLRGVRPVDHDPRVRRPGDLPQREVVAGQQGLECDRWGRWDRWSDRLRHGVRSLHPAPFIWMKRTLRSRFPAT